jgi:phenylacetate-CoA ligase
MKKLFKQLLNKQLRYSPFFYKRLKAIQELEKLSHVEIDRLQEKKFIFLLHKAYSHSAFYASLYKKHRININKIKSVQDLQYLPVITKHEVVEHREAIFIGSRFNKIKANTSGTSGFTVRVYRDYQSIVEEGAYQWAHRMKFGHQPGMKTVVLRGNLDIQKKEQYDPFTKTLYLSSYHLNIKNAEWYYKRIEDFAPHAIFAYPSSLESLANFFMVLGKTLHVPVIFTSSETLYSYQREKIERVFESRIIDWYGNSERTIALKEEADGWYDQVPLYSVNEFKKDHIITTSLINASFPLIRYKVDDVVQLHTDPHTPPLSSGRRVKEIQGRSDDVLILPDGTRIGLLCGAFDGVDHVLLSQIVQEGPHTFYVNVVVTDKYNGEDEALLKQQLENYIGPHVPYTIRYVSEDKIIKSKSGKFKLIVNTMQPNNSNLRLMKV